MKFLIDERLHTTLLDAAKLHGHEATHVNWRGWSGMQDWNLMQPIRDEDFTFVTNNAKDFRKLYARADIHAGLIVIVPNAPPADQRRLFDAVLNALAGQTLLNEVVEISRDGGEARIARYPLPA